MFRLVAGLHWVANRDAERESVLWRKGPLIFSRPRKVGPKHTIDFRALQRRLSAGRIPGRWVLNLRRTTTTLILVTALLACKGGGKNDEQYKTEKVDRGTVTMTVTATGTLSAVTTVQVGSQVSGVIARLYADFNSQVKKGQMLAELDPTPFTQQMEQRRADVTRSQVFVDDARLKYNR